MSAFRCHALNLESVGEFPKAAAVEYADLCNDDRGVAPKDRIFLSGFFQRLRKMRASNPDSSAVDDVLSLLPEIPGHPEYRSIARALCLIADENYDDALQLLSALESELQPASVDAQFSEYRNIPLYAATALVLGGGSEDAVREELQNFAERNLDRSKYLVKKPLIITYDIEKIPSLNHRVAEITAFLVDLGIATKPSPPGQVGDELYVHLMDIHQIALRNLGRWQESKAICVQLADEYFPKYGGAVNALFSLGLIYCQEEDDNDAARECFKRIIENPKARNMRRKAQSVLLSISMANPENAEETALLAEELSLTALDESERQTLTRIIQRTKE